MRTPFSAALLAMMLIGAIPGMADEETCGGDIIVASVPDVPDAASTMASAVEDGVVAALDANLFADPNATETEMLIAQDLASLRVETTGAIASAAIEPSENSELAGVEQDLLP